MAMRRIAYVLQHSAEQGGVHTIPVSMKAQTGDAQHEQQAQAAPGASARGAGSLRTAHENARPATAASQASLDALTTWLGAPPEPSRGGRRRRAHAPPGCRAGAPRDRGVPARSTLKRAGPQHSNACRPSPEGLTWPCPADQC
jgi:hypothetical protein